MKAAHLQMLMAMLMFTLPPVAAAAVDDFKVMKLEQDVRRLEQQVRELSRQISQLQRDAGTSGDWAAIPPPREPAAPETSPLWFQAKNWQRLQVGMSELQVIDALGPPTSIRGAADADAKVLFYALEIGTGNFLSGSVELRDRRVVEISTPVLK